jgi:hypothetical protein
MGLIRPNFLLTRLLPTITFTDVATTTTDGTSHSFVNMAIGAAHPRRRVFVVVQLTQNGGSVEVSSATIGGIAAVIHIGTLSTTGVAILSALVPTGTTATVVINVSAESDGFGILVYRAINLRSTSPFHTAFGVESGDKKEGTLVVTCSLNIPDQGIILAASSSSASWTGVNTSGNPDGAITVVGDDDLNPYLESICSNRILPAQAGRTISQQTGFSSATMLALSWQ